MELRRATESFLRIAPTTWSSFLPPASYHSCIRTVRRSHQIPSSTRQLSTTSQKAFQRTWFSRQQATALKEEPVESESTSQQQEQSSSDPSTSTTTTPQSTSAARPTARNPRPDDDLNDLINKRVGDFARASQRTSQPSPTSNAPRPSPPPRRPTRGRIGMPDMLNINPATFPPTTPIKPLIIPNDTRPAPFRISAALGRTVEVSSKNADLARAFRRLDIRCNANNVKRDVAYQRFHERPGLKRKRLHSERWRKRFKSDFQTTVRRVEDLRRKGW